MKQDATHDGDHGPRYDSDKPNVLGDVAKYLRYPP